MYWEQIKVIAVIGASPKPERDSYHIVNYFISKGFMVIPVNPNYEEVAGQKCYPSLMSIPAEIARTIDMVDIFRRSSEVLPIVQEAVKLKKKYDNLKVVWMQLGVSNAEAARLAQDAGLEVIMDACAMVTHKKTQL